MQLEQPLAELTMMMVMTRVKRVKIGDEPSCIVSLPIGHLFVDIMCLSFIMCMGDDMRQCDISVVTFRQQVLGTSKVQPAVQMDL